MLEILTPVVVALLGHLGKRTIDHFWDRMSQEGSAAATRDDVVPMASLAPRVEAAEPDAQTVFVEPLFAEGALFPPDAAPIVLAVNERTGDALLAGEQGPGGALPITLAPGLYSFYGFVVGTAADDLADAPIYAFGLPTELDLGEAIEVELGAEVDFWDVVSTEPWPVGDDGPYVLSMLMTDELDEDFPPTFADLLDTEAAAGADLTGTWDMREEYEYGTTQARVSLVQDGSDLSGYVVSHDVMADGQELLLREHVLGTVFGDGITLQGTQVDVLVGGDDDYSLDSWEGAIQADGTVVGRSVDAQGVEGWFVMVPA